MPSSMAKKASSTAARRCIIRNFTLIPSLTCGTICPPPGPSVHEASHLRADRRLAVHDRGDAGQEVLDHLYETCVPPVREPAATPPRRWTAVNIYKTSPFQAPVGRRPCAHN